MKGQSQDFEKKSKATLKEPLKDFFLFLAVLKLYNLETLFLYHEYVFLTEVKIIWKKVLRDEHYWLFLCLFGGEAPGETQTHLCEFGENFGEDGKANFLTRWRLHRQNVPRARTSEKPCKGRLNKTYVCMYVLVSCLQAIVARGNWAS